MNKVITVFGSSRPVEGDPEYAQAIAVGQSLADAGFTLCNGGYGGTMEAGARGAKMARGRTIGVTVELFPRKANQWVDQEIRMPSLVQRIQTLTELGSGYVVLKGGTGTLLELAYVWEFINKRFMEERPIVVVGSFWSGVIATLRDELMWEGMGDCTKFIREVPTPEECGPYLRTILSKTS